MPLSTYTELQASIASWLMRDDLTAQIPDFIVLCEKRCNRRLRVREMEETITMSVEPDGTFTLPVNYIEARRVQSEVDPVSVLSSISLDLAALYSTPSYPYAGYTIQGSALRVHPHNTADVTMVYWSEIPPLASFGTNWLLTKAPELYLWGTLLQSAPFLEDDNRIVTWGNLYEAAVKELSSANDRAVVGKTISRVRMVTP